MIAIQAPASSIRKIARANPQPLAAAQLPDSLLNIKTVCAIAGLSRTTVWRKCKAGDMPKPVRVGANCIRWPAGTVTDWLRSKAAQ